MAVTYTRKDQGKTISVGTGAPSHSAVVGDEYTDTTSGIHYVYISSWKVLSTYSTASAGTNIHFSASTIFGTYSSPETGNITNTLTNSKIGVVQKIYHNSGSAPTVPAGWVLLGSTTYQTSTLNIIYAEWSEGTRVEYWIVR